MFGALCAFCGFVDNSGRVLRRISGPGGRERFNLAYLARVRAPQTPATRTLQTVMVVKSQTYPLQINESTLIRLVAPEMSDFLQQSPNNNYYYSS